MKAIFRLLFLFLIIPNCVKSQSNIDQDSIINVINLVEKKLSSTDAIEIEIKFIFYGCYGESTIVSSIQLYDSRITLLSFIEDLNGKLSYKRFSFTINKFLGELEKHKSIVKDYGNVLVISGASQKIEIEYKGQKEIFYTDKGVIFGELFRSGKKLTIKNF
jgi:hypothetical protein